MAPWPSSVALAQPFTISWSIMEPSKVNGRMRVIGAKRSKWVWVA